MYHFKIACRFLSASLVSGLVWFVASGPAAAQVPSDQIINALTPAVTTRGLTVPQGPAPSDTDRAFINSLRHRTRSLTLDEGEHVAALGKDRPTIDLDIYFDYNSADVASKAEPQLTELGNALRDPRLKGSVVVLGGHTDGKGSAAYNQKLSERRAAAVKKYLVEKLKNSRRRHKHHRLRRKSPQERRRSVRRRESPRPGSQSGPGERGPALGYGKIAKPGF